MFGWWSSESTEQSLPKCLAEMKTKLDPAECSNHGEHPDEDDTLRRFLVARKFNVNKVRGQQQEWRNTGGKREEEDKKKTKKRRSRKKTKRRSKKKEEEEGRTERKKRTKTQ